MTCEKCPHCKRIAEKIRNPKVKIPKIVEPIRKCLKCGMEKKIQDYSKTSNSNSISETYRKTCKKCVIDKQRDYMKAYHKKHYVSQKKPRDENGKIIKNTDDVEKNNI